MKHQLIPQKLLDQTADVGRVPCWQCPYFTQMTAVAAHQWPYGCCEKGWLPRDFTLAALDEGNTGAKFGSSARKLARLCPHTAKDNAYLISVYVLTDDELPVMQRRLQLMCDVMPGAVLTCLAVMKL